MPKIVRENIDKVNAVLTLDIPKEEYSKVWKEKLKEHSQKMQIKGFRKGKIPVNYIKKMYGKQIMMDVVNEILQTEIPAYIKEENLDLLGQPLPNSAEDTNVYDIKTPQDLIFKFDIGLAPEFTLKGVDKKSSYDYFDVSIEEDLLDEEVKSLENQLGERDTLTEGALEDNDVVKVKLEELDGKSVKENGVSNEVSVFIGKLTDKSQKALLKKKIGESLNVDIFDFEKDEPEANVRKHLLGLSPDNTVEVGKKFKATILQTIRLRPAALNAEILEKAFPGKNITDDKGAKAEIETRLKAHFGQQADVLFFNKFIREILAKNELEIPETFLKRWMTEVNDEMSPQDLANQLPAYIESIKWTLIKNAMMKKMDIKVEKADMENAARKQASTYFGGQVDEAMMNNIVEYILKDEKESQRLYEEASSTALIKALKENVKLKLMNITSKKFVEEIKKFNEQNQPQPQPEHEHVHDENCDHDH